MRAMATLRSINVVVTCRECGPIEDFTEINGKRFCSACLAEALDDRLMVPVAHMDTIEVEEDNGIYSYECTHCGKLRDTGDGACPHCGEQDMDVDGHYICTKCKKLTKNGRNCDHCGRH